MPAAADLRYPVGEFDLGAPRTPGMREPAIAVLESLPGKLRAATSDLSHAQLDTPYRPGGWTIRQLVHHVADSHMNAYTRTKLALTEDNPTIKPYDQEAWATMADSRLPIDGSLAVLAGIHERWVVVWRAMTPADFSRTFNHPELGALTLDNLLHLYAWHSRHHLAHVTGLRARQNW